MRQPYILRLLVILLFVYLSIQYVPYTSAERTIQLFWFLWLFVCLLAVFGSVLAGMSGERKEQTRINRKKEKRSRNY